MGHGGLSVHRRPVVAILSTGDELVEAGSEAGDSQIIASNAFGPRLLRNFIRDRGNQLVLGTFTATFVYCLLVLRTVRGESGASFVPHVSITAALALTLVNVGVLIFFIHHVSNSIQADQVVAIAGHDLEHAIDELHAADAPAPEDVDDRALEGAGIPFSAPRSGYLQAIEEEGLLATLREHDGVARLSFRPGHFVIEGAELARIWLPAEAPAEPEAIEDAIREAFLIDDRRTPLQDLEFSLHQLVEIAIGRRHDPHVHTQGPVVADTLELVLL